MDAKILLVNREVGVNHQTYPVCGKSGKNYGGAVPDAKRNAMVFEMSPEDYLAAKIDIVTNGDPGQSWVPEFVGPEQNLRPHEKPEEPVKQRVKELEDGGVEVDGAKFSKAFLDAFTEPNPEVAFVVTKDGTGTIGIRSHHIKKVLADNEVLREELRGKGEELKLMAKKAPAKKKTAPTKKR